jgi:hypothetical protein
MTRLVPFATLALAALSCGAGDGAPRGVVPGTRLAWEEVATPVRDWSFASGEDEVALETVTAGGHHSVTVWCVVVGGRLYVATDNRRAKRWVRLLDATPRARIGIRQRAYPVEAHRVQDRPAWDAVVAAYAKKYGAQLTRHDFPRAGDLGHGRIFELRSR